MRHLKATIKALAGRLSTLQIRIARLHRLEVAAYVQADDETQRRICKLKSRLHDEAEEVKEFEQQLLKLLGWV